MASAVPTAEKVMGTAFRSARAITTGTEPLPPRPPPRPPRPAADAPFGLSPEDEHEISSSGNATRRAAGRACLGMRITTIHLHTFWSEMGCGLLDRAAFAVISRKSGAPGS